MNDKQNTRTILKEIITHFKKHQEEIALLLVVNLKSSSIITDNCFDYETEYFSDEELNDFICVLNQLNIYHDISYGESDFVSKINSDYFSKIPHKYKIVYNTTGSKRIRARSALIPSICELHDMLYASSDILTASILENKIHSFALLHYHGFSVPRFWIYHNLHGWINSAQPAKDILLIAKPAYECASIGITQKSVSIFDEVFQEHIIETSTILKQPIIVQEFIRGWEVEVPVFDIGTPAALSVVGIQIDGEELLNDKFLPYESIYSDNYSFYDYERVNPNLSSEIKQIACDSYKALDLSGTVRVDFRISENNIPYITDYNNSPHLTKFHSCAKSVEYYKLNYTDMFCMIFYKALSKAINNDLNP